MRVAVHSSGRQDWGILHPVCAAIARQPGLELRLITGGMHARGRPAPRNLDGFRVDARLDDLPSGDGDGEIAQAAARTAAALARHLIRLDAECLVLCGDRIETLAAATTATALRIPICHLHGGETSLGAIDDSIRHAITRLASLHGVAHRDFAVRLRRWDVPARRIVACGAPALDDLLGAELPDAAELERHLGRAITHPLVLLTHHPVTLGDPLGECEAVLAGLGRAIAGQPQALVIITRPNSDAGNSRIARAIHRAAAGDHRLVVAGDLGSRRWWGLMAQADAMLGNSSSALIEAPCFALPAVNVGERQRGRLRLDNIIDCPADVGAVARALRRALQLSAGRRLPRRPRPTALGTGLAGVRLARALVRLAALPIHKRLATVDA